MNSPQGALGTRQDAAERVSFSNIFPTSTLTMTGMTTAQKLRAQNRREAQQQATLTRQPLQQIELSQNQPYNENDENQEPPEDPEAIQRAIEEEEALIAQRERDIATHKKDILYSNYYWGGTAVYMRKIYQL